MERINYMTMHSFKKKYGSDAACLKALLDFRMNEDGLCFNPRCKSSIDKYYHPLRGKRAYICSRCLTHIYPSAGSIMDHTHLPISDWFAIMFQILYSRNGVSAKEIHRVYGYSYRCIFKMMHSIRELMGVALDAELFNNTAIEIDESFVNTGVRGLGRHYPFKKGRGSLRTTSILGIIERRGYAKFIVIPDTSASSIIPLIVQNVPTTTVIYTDSWGAYNQLKSLGYEHAIVNHSKFEFVDYNTSASTNAAESAFSNLKRCVRGTWRNVSHDKLQNYLWESAFRHSYRDCYDYGFETLLKNLAPLSDIYGESKRAA